MAGVSLFYGLLVTIGIVLIIVYGLKRFVLTVQWSMADLYLVVIALAGMSAWVVGSMKSDVRDARGIILVGVACLLANTPLVLGAWMGLNFARRLDEQRTPARLGLILVGWLTVFAVILGLFVISWTLYLMIQIARKTGDVAAPALMVGFGWAAVALCFLPMYFIEARCRRAELRRRETRGDGRG